MFETICDLIPRDSDYPARTRNLDILNRVLEGRIYDVLPFQFHDERGPGGDYIPLRARRPSIRYPLSRIVVEDSVALLFSEGHFPMFDCADRQAQVTLTEVVKETRLNLVMTEAAIRGSIGSAAVLLRVLKGRIFFQVLNTMFLAPVWSPEEPDTLIRVTERYKVPAAELIELGYEVDRTKGEHWFQRTWDDHREIWYEPVPVGTDAPLVIDNSRSVEHDLGFVPIVWIKNLPGPSSSGSASEGACTFRAAIETQIEIDYQLSQAGRGLKYSSDPTLLLKEPIPSANDILRGAGNALVVGETGDARLLEIGGTASAAVIEYVRTLRELALESVHGNRSSPDRLTAAQSGRALELMNQGLIWLADNLRITYGEGALLALATMIARASRRCQLRVMGREVAPLDPHVSITLKWPRWYAPSAEDRQRDAQTLATLAASGHISRDSAVRAIADAYDIEDIDAELARINNDQVIKEL
jgi:hypothetical protein